MGAAGRALGRLGGSVQTLPNPGLFVAMYVRKKAVLSTGQKRNRKFLFQSYFRLFHEGPESVNASVRKS